jgi:hypothetical protein
LISLAEFEIESTINPRGRNTDEEELDDMEIIMIMTTAILLIFSLQL